MAAHSRLLALPRLACRCDGTGPGDAPPDEQAATLLTAGELAAFLAGARGICLLQLFKGWGDTSDGQQQPLLRPWVLTLLQEAAGHKGVALLQSAAPGEAAQLGATLVLAAKQQPWQAWAKHLAGLGVQSSIVADSPFYKLLIGGASCLSFSFISVGPGCGAEVWAACGCQLPTPGAASHCGLALHQAVAAAGWPHLNPPTCAGSHSSSPAGRMLGYKEANIRHHIESTGGQLSSEVVAAVDAELAGLSAAAPQLPWAGRGSRRGKA